MPFKTPLSLLTHISGLFHFCRKSVGAFLREGDVHSGTTIPAGSAECPSASSTDVSLGAWYHDAVDFVLKNGLMIGTGDGLYEPNASLTRAQLAMILIRLCALMQ